MKTYADKKQENKSQPAVNSAIQRLTSTRSTFEFSDKRPEVVAQRRLKEIMNANPQTRQLRAFQEMANNSPQSEQARQLQAIANASSMQQESIQPKVIQRVAATDIKESNDLFKINDQLANNYNSYVKKVESIISKTEKNNYANGLLNWAVQYHKEAAGSDAELRRVLYHEQASDEGNGNRMRLGRNNTKESDIVGDVAGKKRSEEVKAVTTTNSDTVESQINRSLKQLEDTRAINKPARKVVIYIYNNRNPWPFDSINSAKGKSNAAIKTASMNRLKSKHKRVKGGIHIVVNDVNKFTASKKNNGTTTIEMTWPNAAEKTPAKRRTGIKSQVGGSASPFRTK
ncbi:MAG: hypothetical protein AAGG59_07615 [Bacteroidota bacterium]